MTPGSREIELKLHAAPDDLARLRDHPALARYGIAARRMRRMVTTYFDTPDHLLAQSGIALRVRRIGRRYIQTVKARARAEAGESAAAAMRGEWEWRVAGNEPDLSLIEGAGIVLPEGLAEARLAPIFRTDIERTSIEVTPDAASRIEISFDRGTIRAEGAEAAVSEVELELLPPTAAGRVALLYEVARALHDAVPLRIGTESKADLGYALLGANPAKPRKAVPVALAPAMTVGDAFARVAAACAAHLLDNQRSVVEAADAEGIRQMRIALRRLRAAIALFAPVLGAAPASLKEEVRWLAGALAPARDWDVFADILAHEARAAVAAAVLPEVEAARCQAHREAAAVLASPRYTALLLDLARWIEERRQSGADRHLGDAAPALLDRRAKKLRRRAKGIGRLTIAQRHSLRKSLKAMRYAAGFLAPLYPHRHARRYLHALAAMQDVLGATNDLAVAEALATRFAKTTEGEAALAWRRLRRRLREQHAARLAKLPGAWESGAGAAEPFWR